MGEPSTIINPQETRTRTPYESPSITVRTDRSRLRNTEAGMSPALAASVKSEESIAVPLRKERIAILDENGRVLGTNMGTEGQVAAPRGVNLNNAIITHNHPMVRAERKLGRSLASRVGTTLSPDDVKTSIRNNVKEIRAITRGGYLYSLKRPASGWGVSEVPKSIQPLC